MKLRTPIALAAMLCAIACSDKPKTSPAHDAGIHCTSGGKSYAPGDKIWKDASHTEFCVCGEDGTIGECGTSDAGVDSGVIWDRDAGGSTCFVGGHPYLPEETVWSADNLTSCTCKVSGKLEGCVKHPTPCGLDPEDSDKDASTDAGDSVDASVSDAGAASGCFAYCRQYSVGQTVWSDPHHTQSCRCLADGKIGQCTGAKL